MSEGRTTRVLAAVAVAASVALAVFTAVERREIRGRIHLRAAAAARGEAVDDPLRGAIRMLGPADPRIRELLRVERGDLEVQFSPVGPTASATPAPGKPLATAVVKNVSTRRLYLFLERSAFPTERLVFSGGGGDGLDDLLAMLPPAIALEPGESFTVEDGELPDDAAWITGAIVRPPAEHPEEVRTLTVTVHACVAGPTDDLEIEGPTVRFVPGAPPAK